RSAFLKSLEYLNRDKVRVLHLHAPDRSVPFEDTARGGYMEYRAETFGLSNFTAWEVQYVRTIGLPSNAPDQVAEIVIICKVNDCMQSKIYQAAYNDMTRKMETELLRCCRKFGIRAVDLEFSDVSHGPKLSSYGLIALEEGSRFDPRTNQGANYRRRYLKGDYFKALRLITAVAEMHDLRTTEIARRWCQHSALTPDDGIILGASSVAQLVDNCVGSMKGPLLNDVLGGLDEAYRVVKLAHGSVPADWQ
ncbi:hypothetical protein BDN67DRAFT_877614, partial [Paxillus ammoniavirescens]